MVATLLHQLLPAHTPLAGATGQPTTQGTWDTARSRGATVIAMPDARRGGQSGGATIELALCTPLLLALLMLAVLAGRVAQTRAEVDAAARDAARAASITRDGASAGRAAHHTALATLGQHGVTCRRLDVAVDTTSFRAGGVVAVRLACTIDLADLSLLRVPGSRTVTTRFVEPLDTFRETR
jgi:Flp pilus assembly protein TadG